MARFIVIACALALAAPGAWAATWTVWPDGSGNAPTIQAAIDSSRSGDVVIVKSGTYYEEELLVDGKDIMISGDGLPVVVSSAPGSGTGITLRNVSSGFFLFNLNFDGFNDAILVENGAPAIWIATIKHCNRGIGVSGGSSSPDISYCLVDSCVTAIDYGEGSGSVGGTIENNTVVHCTNGIAAGSGLVDINYNIIYDCEAGIVYSGATLALICNCLYANTVDYQGGPGGSSDFHLDPLFCIVPSAPGPYYLDTNSPCWESNNSCGHDLGAFTLIDCEGSGTEESSWSEIKKLFR